MNITEVKKLLEQWKPGRFIIPEFPKDTVFYADDVFDIPLALIMHNDGGSTLYRFDVCPPRPGFSLIDTHIIKYNEFCKITKRVQERFEPLSKLIDCNGKITQSMLPLAQYFFILDGVPCMQMVHPGFFGALSSSALLFNANSLSIGYPDTDGVSVRISCDEFISLVNDMRPGNK